MSKIASMHCEICGEQIGSTKALYELEREVKRLKDSFRLPIITDDIRDMMEGTGMIDDDEWTQEAVDFACIIREGGNNE